MTAAQELPAGEKPLSAFLKFCVAAAAVLLLIACYGFWIVFVVLLLLFLVIDLALLIVGLRFGLGYFAMVLVRRHVDYLTIFVRAIFLRNPIDVTVPVSREDAPALYETVEKLAAQMHVDVPNEIVLEMGATAWIQLKGLLRGTGRARLGLGYDFLQGLGRNELEAIIAHEMAHAKLVQRGFNLWLGRGIARMATLTSALLDQQVHEQEGQQGARERFSFFAWSSELATKWGCRLLAAYHRQDEFEADRAAADWSGVALYCHTLKNVHQLAILSESLSWRERIARLQRGEGFGQWLKDELVLKEGTRAHKKMKNELRQSLANKYSTHPSLKDRVAVLGGSAQTEELSLNPEPAIQLLAAPDVLAEKLVSKLQEVIAKEEEKDTRALLKFTKKVNRSRQINVKPVQLLGGIIVVAAAVTILFIWLSDAGSGRKVLVTFCSVIGAAGGVLLCRLGGYRDRFGLPVPRYDELKRSYEAELAPVKVQTVEKRIEEEFQLRLGAEKMNRKSRLKYLITEGYQGLAACDYLRANVAGRLCMQIDGDSVEGSVLMAVSGGYFGNPEHFEFGLNNLLRVTAINGPLNWAVGWAMMLMGQWPQAEAYLLEATRHKPDQPTVWMLLAACQMRREKLHSAVIHARKACALQPEDKPLSIALVRMLLECGFVREASDKLRAFEKDFATDLQLMLCIIHLNLLSGHRDAASDWYRYFETQKFQTTDLLELADIYNRVRCNGEAESLYKKVASRGFYPAAHFGLGQVYTRKDSEDAARREFKTALNVVKPIGHCTIGPLQLMQPIFGELASLREPVATCIAWVATLDLSNSPAKIQALNLLVYAQSPKEVEEHVEFLYTAMHPDRRFDPNCFRVLKAGKRMQPDSPVCPGIQGILI